MKAKARCSVLFIALLLAFSYADISQARGGGGGRGGGNGGGGESGEVHRSGGHGEVEFERHGGRHGGEDFSGHGGSRHGSIVRDMPSGYIEVFHMGQRHFFHEGRFFDRHRDGFVVVNAPIGMKVPTLQIDASRVFIGGEELFLAGGNYFRRVPDGFVAVAAPHR